MKLIFSAKLLAILIVYFHPMSTCQRSRHQRHFLHNSLLRQFAQNRVYVIAHAIKVKLSQIMQCINIKQEVLEILASDKQTNNF